MKIELMAELNALTDKINLKYYSLAGLSNDNLRTQMSIIQTNILESKNLEQSLDENLVDVFALVKELARRLSVGDVSVTANKNDRELAIEYDFVTVKDNQATYKNKWQVCGNEEEWKMVHYDEQLMGGILLHRGYAVEMATGEGKTLAATLPVMLNALSHKGVHLMTVNDYLSKRDFELTRPLYMFFGVAAGCIELSDRHSQFHKDAYKADVVFGTNSQFTFDYLYDHLATRKEDCIQTDHHYAIIDELDSNLIDEAETPHIVSGGDAIDVGEKYRNVKQIFEDFIAIDDNTLYVVDKTNHYAYFTAKGKEELEKKLSMPGLFESKKINREIDEEEMPSPQEKEILEKLEMQNTLNQMLYAYKIKEKDVDYIVKNNTIVIIDEHTGRPKPTHRWSYGLHTAVEVKENVKTMNEHDGMATISLKNYLNLYDKKCGMSGTIMAVSQELSDVYGLQSAKIPTHKPMIREDLPLRVFYTEAQKDKAMIDYVLKLHDAGRPVLVGCLNIKRSEHIANIIDEMGLPFQRLDAKSLEKEAIIVSQAGQQSAITISTSIAGRGTDIKLSSESKEVGGLAIVGTDLFDSIRVDNQLKGRAGRQGDPGTSCFFVSLEDLILKNLTIDEKKELEKHVNNYPEKEEMSYDEIRHYVFLAQKHQEEYAHLIRQNLNRKDDLIAPHRIDFYKQRSQLLFDSNAANDFINHIASKDTLVLIDKHIDALHEQVKNLLVAISSGEKLLVSIPLVFTEGKRLFTIIVDIQAATTSRKYFAEEYKRQMVLQTFDRYWKHFVSHVLSNLNSKEIGQLPEDYTSMKQKIGDAVLRRLLVAEMPIRHIAPPKFSTTDSDNTKWEPTPMHLKRRTMIVEFDNNYPCPCGSGKKFSECHGSSIRFERLKKY